MGQDTALQQRLHEVAQRLLAETLNGNVDWRTTDDEDAFLYSGSSASIIIDYFSRNDSYSMRILNSRGTLVEELRSESAPEAPWGTSTPAAGAAWNETLSSLHNAARRRALNIDTLITSVLRDLDESRPPF